MRFGSDGLRVVLDFLIIASDTFQWISASESPFGWRIQELGKGLLLTRFGGAQGALPDVSDIGDAVHLASTPPVRLIDRQGRGRNL